MQEETYVNLGYENLMDFAEFERNSSSSFKGLDGLSFTVVEPLKVWKIQFNGMLKAVSTGETKHVIMSFL